MLRSQGQEFAKNLEQAGVPTGHHYAEGVMHEFFGASAVLDRAEEAQQAAAQHFLRAFGSGEPYPAGNSTSASSAKLRG